MERISMRFLLAGAAAAIALQTPALAAEVEVKGIIVTNENGQLTVKTPNGDQTIALRPDARVRSISGVLGGQKEAVTTNALIPGLPVTITVDDSTGAPGWDVDSSFDARSRKRVRALRRSFP